MVKLSRKKILIFGIAAVTLGSLFLEGALSFIWLGAEIWKQSRLDTSQSDDTFKRAFSFHPELGWAPVRNNAQPDYYGRGRSLTVNSQGARGAREYENPKPEDRYRILCIGDSFTFGHGVDDADCFPAQLEAIHPLVEAVNLGVPGYSTGQGWLMAQRATAEFTPDLVLVTLIWADLKRMTIGIPGYENEVPKFKLTENGFEMYGIPIPEPAPGEAKRGLSLMEVGRIVSRNSAIGRGLKLMLPTRQFGPHNVTDNTLDEMLKIGCLIYAKLNKQAKEEGRTFALVLMPEITDITVEFDRQTFGRISEHLTQAARTEGYPILDLREKFLAQQEEVWRNFYLDPRMDENEHSSAAGNKFIAEEIHGWLARVMPDYPDASTSNSGADGLSESITP